MLKKILSLTLCLCICFGVVFSATSCGSSKDSSTTNSTTTVPTTLSFLGITSEETDPDNIKMVEEALNEIFTARFKIKIDLTLVTEDKYMDLVEERIKIAKEYKVYDDAIAQYNAYIKKQANKTTTTNKIFGNWISGGVKVTLETLATRLVYVSEQTTVHEDGRVETLYPEAPSPIDIVMIVDEKMYDDFTDMGLLLTNNIDPTLTSYKNLQKYIYPTFFTELQNLKQYINAIPNNNMLAESTYLVVNKELAEKYDFNIEAFKNYSDLSGFLAQVKENEEIVPFKNVPEALGVFKLFSEDVAIGAYLDPLVGYNPEEGEKYASYEIKNLFEIKEYTDHLALMEDYQNKGYFSREDYAGNGYAVEVIKGDASIAARYDSEDSEYLVKEIQVPFVLREAIFDGMLAPTAYTSDIKRSMQIIEAINTDSDVKNILQYGIEGYNYIPNEETGSIIQLNGSYIMDNALTGNAYVGYVPYEPDSEKVTAWSYVMQTNLSALSSPFLLFPVDEVYLQEHLSSIITRAGLSQALEITFGITYDEYMNASAADLADYRKILRKPKAEGGYREYLIDELIAQNKAADKEKAETIVATVDIAWVEETIAKLYTGEYDKVATIKEIETLVGNQLSGENIEYAVYENARKKASGYLSNIASLRVVARETLFADMTDEEYEAKYGVLGVIDFEKAVYEYLKTHYEEENNLTEEDYRVLVQDFIASNFQFTDRATNEQYTYTWDEFIKIKEEAMKFATPLQAAKAQYSNLIKEIGGASQEQIDSWNDIELADNILKTIRTQFYNNSNTTEEAFQTWLYDNIILSPFNITKQDLDILRVKDNTLYKDYLAKIKKQYKTQLLENYTKDEYAAMKDSDALTAVLDYYVEAYTQAYATLCGAMGLSLAEYEEYHGYAEIYKECVETKMKKTFLYTLRTRYTDAELNAMSVAETEKAVYDIVYESGYYMNELAKCIGIDLSAYNNSKSEAIAYLGETSDVASNKGYLASVIKYYEAGLAKKGYTTKQAMSLDPEELEEIIREIIREDYFADYVTVDVELARICSLYLEVAEDCLIDNSELEKIAELYGLKVEELIDKFGDGETLTINHFINMVKEDFSTNYLLNAVSGYLNDELQAKLEAANG